VPAPRDFIAWLLKHRDLATERAFTDPRSQPPGPSSRRRAHHAEPRHRHGLPECREYCVALAPDAWFGQGWKVCFIVIESGRKQVVITVEALPGDFARFSARALGVLKSLRSTQAP
jgi:hypothetical protein